MSFRSRNQAEREYDLQIEAPRMARITALLYGCGAAFVAASILLPHPPGADTEGLWLIAVIALTASISIYTLAESFNAWSIHIVLLVGSGLIADCVALSGSASGIYAAMYIWVVLVAARSFSIYGLVFQLFGILATYGVALSTLTAGPNEFALETRWLLSVFALGVTGVISLRLVSDARRKEADLIRLTGMAQPDERKADAFADADEPADIRLEAAPAAGSLAGQGR